MLTKVAEDTWKPVPEKHDVNHNTMWLWTFCYKERIGHIHVSLYSKVHVHSVPERNVLKQELPVSTLAIERTIQMQIVYAIGSRKTQRVCLNCCERWSTLWSVKQDRILHLLQYLVEYIIQTTFLDFGHHITKWRPVAMQLHMIPNNALSPV